MNDELIQYLEGLIERLKRPAPGPAHVLDQAVTGVVAAMQAVYIGEQPDYVLGAAFNEAAAVMALPFIDPPDSGEGYNIPVEPDPGEDAHLFAPGFLLSDRFSIFGEIVNGRK